MIVELDKVDLINLVLHVSPITYEESEEAERDGYGKLVAFPNERWLWDINKLRSLTEEQLYALYRKWKGV